jgi:hypothetical protein
MLRLSAVVTVMLIAATSAAQSPPRSSVPATASATSASPSAEQGAVCDKDITIYLDLSGSMTAQRPDGAPVTKVASTLDQMLATEGVLGGADTVTIKIFGPSVETWVDDRKQIKGALDRLKIAPASVASEFRRLNDVTDFGPLLADIESRLTNSGTRRQIFIVASDFAHDPRNENCQNVESRNAAFDDVARRLPGITAALDSDSAASARVRFVGFQAPPGCDAAVSKHVVDFLAGKGVTIVSTDADAKETARRASLEVSGLVMAMPLKRGAASIAADGNVAFRVVNGTCGDVRVTHLRFSGTPEPLEIEPTTVRMGSSVVYLASSSLSSIWNSTQTVEPVLSGPVGARSVKSEQFWLGDAIRVDSMEPLIADRWANGRVALVLKGEIALKRPSTISVSGLRRGGALQFHLRPIVAAEVALTAPYERELWRDDQERQVTITSTGPRILGRDAVPAVTLDVKLTVPTRWKAGPILDWVGAFLILLWLVTLLIRIFWHVGGTIDEPGSTGFARVGGEVAGAVVQLLGVLFTAGVPLPSVAGADYLPVLAAAWRALALGVATYFIIRNTIVRSWWRHVLERQLLPNDAAVSRRHLAGWVLFLLPLILGVLIIYGVAIDPREVLPMLTPLFRGVLK